MRRFYIFLIGLLTSSIVMAQVQVTLQVDMSLETPAPDTVSVAGSFQVAAGFPSDWTPGATLLTDQGNGVWSVDVTLPANTSYEYKFLAGTAWGTDEGVPGACAVNGNRGLNVPASGPYVEPLVCFGQCGPCPTQVDTVDVTLRVSMKRVGILVGISDTVSVAGNFQAAAGFPNDWTPGSTIMTDANNDSIYEVTVRLPEGTYAYKFINGTAWGFDETVPAACNVGGNRELVVVGDGDLNTITDTILNVVCFGRCTETCPPVLPPISVTFKVDVTELINNGTLNSSGIYVGGSFENPAWTKTALAMSQNGAIFEITVDSIDPDEYQFKFWNTDDGDDTKAEQSDFIALGCGISSGVGGSNRLLDLIGVTVDTILPTFYFDSCSFSAPGSVAALFPNKVNKSVSVYPNPFSDYATVTFDNVSSRTITITDLSGKVIREINTNDATVRIEKNGLRSGMYLINITEANGISYSSKLLME